MIIAGNGIYDRCPDCGKLVKLNKRLFGALHFCLSDQDRKALNYLIYMQHKQINYTPDCFGLSHFGKRNNDKR